MKVLAIVPYHTDYCAGQRFRIELWADRLADKDIEVEFLPFTDERLTDVLYQPKKNLRKAAFLLSCFIRQLTKTLSAKKPDVIFIYREAALIGPAVIEKLVGRWGIPIIYDIDEPLFVSYVSPTSGRMNRLRFFSKVDKLFEMSDCVFAVNQAIADYARKYNDNVHVVPMAVDVDRYKPAEKPKNGGRPMIGWVGTRTNQPNIELAVAPMRALRAEKDFLFRIVADYEMDFDGVDTEFVPWSFDVEVPKLREVDIGIVPVKESVWSKWKFFFKTIQFMSMGIPIVASAAGSNLEIITDGVNGFLAKNESEWHNKLKLLIESPELRTRIGEKARQTVLETFSIDRQCDFLEETFRSMAGKQVSNAGQIDPV